MSVNNIRPIIEQVRKTNVDINSHVKGYFISVKQLAVIEESLVEAGLLEDESEVFPLAPGPVEDGVPQGAAWPSEIAELQAERTIILEEIINLNQEMANAVKHERPDINHKIGRENSRLAKVQTRIQTLRSELLKV